MVTRIRFPLKGNASQEAGADLNASCGIAPSASNPARPDQLNGAEAFEAVNRKLVIRVSRVRSVYIVSRAIKDACKAANARALLEQTSSRHETVDVCAIAEKFVPPYRTNVLSNFQC